MNNEEIVKELEQTKEAVELSCAMRASRTGDMKYPKEIEAIDRAIEAVKYMDNLDKNYENKRMLYQQEQEKKIQKCIEKINEKIEECTKGLQAEEHNNDMYSGHIFDEYRNQKIAYCDALEIFKEEMI